MYLALGQYEATATSNADPAAGANGDMYYNSESNQFRCYINGGWQPCNGIWQTVMKTADQTKTSTTAFAADNTLTFAMAASTNYSIRCQIYFGSTSATPQFKWEETGPTGATSIDGAHEAIPEGASNAGVASTTGVGGVAEWVDVGMNTASGTSNSVSLSQLTSSNVALTNAAGEGSLTLNTQWQNGTTAGTWAFQWAQNTTSTTATAVRAGSYCDYVAGD